MILINDMSRHKSATAGVIKDAFSRVVESGWFILGVECRAFEAEFAAYCGVAHCVALANGTDAIELALRALGVTRDSQVITVANAGFYTATALGIIGAKPIYVDIDESSHLMSIEGLKKRLGEGPVAAIVVTHLYGRLHEMEQIMEIAQRVGVAVVEDCAQAHGARRSGRMAGSFADAGAFSFYPTKNLGALGDGGAVTTTHKHVAEKINYLRQYGWMEKYKVGILGGRNSRLDELQAAVLRGKLPLLDAWNNRRRQIASRYTRGLQTSEITCPDSTGEDNVSHLYVVRTKQRAKLRERLTEAGIATDVHYPLPDTKQPCWPGNVEWPSLPVTEKLAEEVLTLPCYPELTNNEVDTVIEAVIRR